MRYVPGSSHSSRLTSFSGRNALGRLRGWVFKKNSRGSFLWSSKNCRWQTEGHQLRSLPRAFGQAWGPWPGTRSTVASYLPNHPAPVEDGIKDWGAGSLKQSMSGVDTFAGTWHGLNKHLIKPICRYIENNIVYKVMRGMPYILQVRPSAQSHPAAQCPAQGWNSGQPSSGAHVLHISWLCTFNVEHDMVMVIDTEQPCLHQHHNSITATHRLTGHSVSSQGKQPRKGERGQDKSSGDLNQGSGSYVAWACVLFHLTSYSLSLSFSLSLHPTLLYFSIFLYFFSCSLFPLPSLRAVEEEEVHMENSFSVYI